MNPIWLGYMPKCELEVRGRSRPGDGSHSSGRKAPSGWAPGGGAREYLYAKQKLIVKTLASSNGVDIRAVRLGSWGVFPREGTKYVDYVRGRRPWEGRELNPWGNCMSVKQSPQMNPEGVRALTTWSPSPVSPWSRTALGVCVNSHFRPADPSGCREAPGQRGVPAGVRAQGSEWGQWCLLIGLG